MKKKALLSSILSIVLCLTMISGATFALFTDSETVNIAVTAGKVDIDVTVKEGSIKVMSREDTDWKVGTTQFTNGGTATFADDNNTLTLDKITPGDKVQFTLVVTNYSNVKIQYRTKLGVTEGPKLFSALDVTMKDSESTEAAADYNGQTYASQWVELLGAVDTVKGDNVAEVVVTIALPYSHESQNELMGESTSMFYTVEAVQGNASEEDKLAIMNGETYIYSAMDLAILSANVKNGNSYYGETVYLMNDIDLAGMEWTPIGALDKPFAGTFTGAKSDVAALASTGDFEYANPSLNYTIKNLKVVEGDIAGLFGYVTGDIYNVNVDNAYIDVTYQAGVIAGYSYGQIRNCNVSNSYVRSTPALQENGTYGRGNNVGGIVGQYCGSNDNAKSYMLGCSVYNTIVIGYRAVGGVVGTVNSYSYAYDCDVVDVTVVQSNTNAYDATITCGKVFGRIAGNGQAYDSWFAVKNSNLVEGVDTPVATAEDLAAALTEGGKIALLDDIAVNETLVVPAGATVVIDLNGKEISGTMHKNDGAIVKNEGTLIINGGTISSEGENGGSAIMNKGALTVVEATLNGAPNANGSWPSYTVNNTGVMTINNATITSTHGAVASYGEGALVTLNDSTIDMKGIPGFTSHGIYTYNSGKVVVNGGTYANKATDQNASGASVINGNVEVLCGEFTGRIENYYGNPVIKGGVFSVQPKAAYLAEGYAVVEVVDGKHIVGKAGSDVVVNATDLNAALNSGKDVVMTEDVTAPDTNSNGYGSTALNVTNGQTIDGNGKTLSAPDANGDWDSAVNITSGTIKNLKIDSGFRGVFINHNGTAGKVYLENVIIDGSVYTISCDQGTNSGLEATNCTFNGWTSYAATLGVAKFTNCNFGKGAGYAFFRPYAETVLTGCTFEVGYQIDACAAVTLVGCYYGDTLITAENIASLGLIVDGAANVTAQ